MSDHNTIQVTIQSTRGTKQFDFEKTAKVADVIATAVAAFGFTQGDKFELVLATNPGQPLQPDRTLVSYQITNGTVLILTAVGGGV